MVARSLFPPSIFPALLTQLECRTQGHVCLTYTLCGNRFQLLPIPVFSESTSPSPRLQVFCLPCSSLNLLCLFSALMSVEAASELSSLCLPLVTPPLPLSFLFAYCFLEFELLIFSCFLREQPRSCFLPSPSSSCVFVCFLLCSCKSALPLFSRNAWGTAFPSLPFFLSFAEF